MKENVIHQTSYMVVILLNTLRAVLRAKRPCKLYLFLSRCILNHERLIVSFIALNLPDMPDPSVSENITYDCEFVTITEKHDCFFDC